MNNSHSPNGNKYPSGKIDSIAIIGGGPAASMLAFSLARSGKRVGIFHLPKRTPLIVGESLVPAIIPFLRMLGVEDEIKAYSTYKPGATVCISEASKFAFPFDQLKTSLPRYSYNVPRDKFDETLLNAARKAGAHVFETAAKLEREPGTDRVRLLDETLTATNGFFKSQPDLIVDATGRARVLPKLLEIPSTRGAREDTVLFAHVDKTKIDNEGHVHMTRLDNGWSWRIPLPGRVSVGVVIGTEFVSKFGATKEERFDNILRQDSVLKDIAWEAKRLTPVMEYSNYQLVTSRIVGESWALVGDTAGFIDPVFSSGMLIGMHSAVALADTITKGTIAAFQKYEAEVRHHLKSWHEIVGYFYDGRLFTCFNVGQKMKDNLLVKMAFPHLNKHFGRIFSGAASTSAYSLSLMRFAMKYGLKNDDPREMMIR